MIENIVKFFFESIKGELEVKDVFITYVLKFIPLVIVFTFIGTWAYDYFSSTKEYLNLEVAQPGSRMFMIIIIAIFFISSLPLLTTSVTSYFVGFWAKISTFFALILFTAAVYFSYYTFTQFPLNWVKVDKILFMQEGTINSTILGLFSDAQANETIVPVKDDKKADKEEVIEFIFDN